MTSQLERMTKVIAAITEERQRQIEREGWTEAHDDAHGGSALPVAAACYALHSASQTEPGKFWANEYGKHSRSFWPFDDEWWKPSDAVRDLVRAAALIVAELERLDRADDPHRYDSEPDAVDQCFG